MLSPVPPCVYLPLPAGLLREQEIESEKGNECEREKPEYSNEKCLQCNQSFLKHASVCLLLH